MALVEGSSVQDRRPSEGGSLNLNLPSNNPFRNRAASPVSPPAELSPRSPTFNERPVSRNPFLDASHDGNKAASSQPPRASQPGMAFSPGSTSPRKSQLDSSALEIFDKLNLNEKPSTIENRPPQARLNGPLGQPGHRPSLSQEEAARARNSGHGMPPKPRRLQPPLDVFADPTEAIRRRESRPIRRSSDTSVASTARNSKLLDPEEERRRRERRHRESKYRDGKPREKGARGSPRQKKPNQRLDIIDKLDVTSIYGTGLFHHDGPFDACNPHRNRKDSSRAPMQAFPKDSANNVIGGSGPVNKDIDHNLFHGKGGEAFSDFSKSGKETSNFEPYADLPPRPEAKRSHTFTPIARSDTVHVAFNPIARVDPVHGDESLGLGTSTFLEGAPASRTAIKRRESESESVPLQGAGGGLGRKKSLAQKIRAINPNRQHGRPSMRVISPGLGQEPAGPVTVSPKQLDRPVTSDDSMRKSNGSNPFFADYDTAYDQKGESISVAHQGNKGRERAMSSPRGGLERRVTNDQAGPPPVGESKASSFLSRVKSLKGGRRAPRPGERAF
ncbi:MAG: hypothetical protein M1832_004629 [Thelocarpon impressellum]|nr:MAG: hypothetical protein M1832_004629 [Thelocarpon impressellum]